MKSTNHFISIVIPAYDEEKYLPRLLDSLEKQDYPKKLTEIIVVIDKKTTDRTEQIARKYNVKIVKGEISGVSSARMHGFKIANGEIIASTDSDCKAPPKWLSTINEEFKKNPEIIGITGPARFYDGSKFYKFISEKPYNMFQMFNLNIGLPSFPGFNFAVRKSAYIKTAGFNPDLPSSEDIDLSLKMKKLGKLVFAPKLKMYTSARRIQSEGLLKFLNHHLNNYINFTLLRKSPLAFKKIR